MKRNLKATISVVLLIAMLFCLSGCGLLEFIFVKSSNAKMDLKARAYHRWQIVIPKEAKEVFNYSSAGIDTGSFGVFETKRDDIEFEMNAVDEEYKTKFLRVFSLYSKNTDYRVDWEHELYGLYKSDKKDTWTLFCVFDADKNLLYVMDTDI